MTCKSNILTKNQKHTRQAHKTKKKTNQKGKQRHATSSEEVGRNGIGTFVPVDIPVCRKSLKRKKSTV